MVERLMIAEAVLNWAKDRGILDNGTVEGQMTKLQEEFDELKDAIAINDEAEIKDAIGDMQVVLIILAELLDMDAQEALQEAYNTISQRKGKMVNGVFVKDGDA